MAYIGANDVKMIREALKARFPKFKFGCRKGAGSLSVDVTIKAGPTDFGACMNPQFPGHFQVNPYHTYQYGEHQAFFDEIVKIIKTAPERGWYDNSDAMSDYFDTAFYFHIEVGSWNKPYTVNA